MTLCGSKKVQATGGWPCFEGWFERKEKSRLYQKVKSECQNET